MKTPFFLSLILGAQMSLASATVIAAPNGDLSNPAKHDVASGPLFGAGQTLAPLGVGPGSVQTSGLLGELAPPTVGNVPLTAVPEPYAAGLIVAGLFGFAYRRRVRGKMILAAAAAISLMVASPGRAGLLGSPSNTTSTLAGVTLLPDTSYEVNVAVTTGDLRGLLGVLDAGGQPLEILDGTGNVLGTVSAEELLEGLVGTDQIQLLNNAGGVMGLVSVSDLVDRLLGTSTNPLSVLDGTGNVLGTLPVTNLLNALLGGILGGGTNLDVLDGLGNVLGTVSVDKLLEAVTGADGGLANTLTILLTTVRTQVLDPVLSVLDTPLLQIGDTTVNPAPIINNNGKPNSRPTVKIISKKRKKGGDMLIVRGTAADADGSINRIQAQQNGRLRKASGRSAWKVRVPLRNGVNRIKISAFDNESTMSPVQTIRVVRR